MNKYKRNIYTYKEQRWRYSYHIFSIFHPKPCYGSVMGILWQQRNVWPSFFNVLENDRGLCDGFATMNKHRHFLVNWIGLQKQLALVEPVLFYILVVDTFELQSPFHSVDKRARPKSQ